MRGVLFKPPRALLLRVQDARELDVPKRLERRRAFGANLVTLTSGRPIPVRLGVVGNEKQRFRRVADGRGVVRFPAHEIRQKQKPRFITVATIRQNSLEMIARVRRIGHQHVELWRRFRRHLFVKVLIPIVHVLEPEGVEMGHHGAFAIIRIVYSQRLLFFLHRFRQIKQKRFHVAVRSKRRLAVVRLIRVRERQRRLRRRRDDPARLHRQVREHSLALRALRRLRASLRFRRALFALARAVALARRAALARRRRRPTAIVRFHARVLVARGHAARARDAARVVLK